jgi:hypothetical protein
VFVLGDQAAPITAWALHHLDQRLDVPHLAAAAGMSVRTVSRTMAASPDRDKPQHRRGRGRGHGHIGPFGGIALQWIGLPVALICEPVPATVAPPAAWVLDRSGGRGHAATLPVWVCDGDEIA